eukprot:gene8295-119_t
MFLLSTLNKSKNTAGEKSEGSNSLGGLFSTPDFSITQATYHEGYLYHKTGATFSPWKKKYYVLKPTKIIVYSNEKRSQELEQIFLEGSSVEPFREKKRNGFVLHGDLRKYILTSENEKEIDEWILKITEIGGSEKKKDTKPQSMYNLKDPNSTSLLSMGSPPTDEESSPILLKTRKSQHKFISPIAKTFSDIVEKKERRDSEIEQKKREIESELEKIRLEELEKKIRKPKYTIEQEFDIFLSAMSIFMKEESKRTPEEKAYILNLKLYYLELNKHMCSTKSKPEFSISTGTYILVKEEEFRTSEENEFITEMKRNYEIWLDNEDEELLLDVFSNSKNIISKPKKQLTKSELHYKRSLEKIRQLISKIEKTHGLKAEFDIISGTVNLLKYDEEISSNNDQYLSSINEVTKI